MKRKYLSSLLYGTVCTECRGRSVRCVHTKSSAARRRAAQHLATQRFRCSHTSRAARPAVPDAMEEFVSA